jgi:predicted  nucleic acid-binding Zn-ribbon protein
MRNREGYIVTREERECTKCGSMFKNRGKTVTLCPNCNSERVKGESPEKKMFRRAKTRAKEKGLDFNLELSDILIPKTCPILGVELICHKGRSGGQPNSPALDRIDNNKGYLKDNIMVISHRANMMKVDASPEELVMFAEWVLSKYRLCIASTGEHK